MSIGVLQERQASGTGSLVSSFSLAFSSNVSAGSAIHGIGAYAAGASPTITFSDNNSNNWGAGSLDTVTDTAGGEVTIHQVAQNLTAAACNVTLTFTGVTRDFPALWIKEIGGVTTTGNPDGHNGVTSASTTSQLISASNASQPALISVLSLNANTQETPVLDASLTASTANPGWDFGTGNKGGVAGHKRITSTGSQSITNTQASLDGLSTVMAIFVESGGGAAATTAWQPIRPMYPPGALPGKLGRFYQSPKSYAVATNVTAALTGQGATFASGTATPGTSVAATGQAATFSAGTVIPATSIAVTGKAATFAAGTVTPSSSISLTGQAATLAAGLLTPTLSLALTGSAMTSGAGTLAPSTTLALTGQVATFSAGTVSAGGSVTAALTGQAASFTAGVLAPSTTIALLGGSASFAAGNLLAASTLALTGQGTSSTAGALARSTAVSLTGLAASFTGGIVTPVSPNVTVGLTGQSSTFTSGTLGISSSLALLGTVGTFATGAVTAVSGNVVALTGSRMTASAGIVGLAQFLVPNVQGVPLGTAALLLNNATLQVGTLTYQNSTLVALGSVISQAPPATTLVLEDSQVALLISSGFVNPTNNPLGEIKLPNLPNKILPPDNALVDDRGVIATNWWRFLLNVANQALGTNQTVPATVTIGASPYVFTTPAQGSLLISGGPVTLIEYSKDAAAWYPTGVTQGLIPMVPNDHVRITYMNAPTLTFFPR